jgi:hypothetical protein
VQLELLVKLVEPRPSQVADLRCKHLAEEAVEHRLELRLLKVEAAAEQEGREQQAEKELQRLAEEPLQYKALRKVIVWEVEVVRTPMGRQDMLRNMGEVEEDMAVVALFMVRQVEDKVDRQEVLGVAMVIEVVVPLALRPQGLAETMDAEMAVGAVHTIPQAEQA